MNLKVEPLHTTLSQTITWDKNSRAILGGIRPYIYIHNAPVGTFTFEVKKGSDVIASKSFSSSEAKSDMDTTDNYIHMWKALQFDNPVAINKGEYTVEMSASGYTYLSGSFVGWIKEYENLIANGSFGTNEPLAVQLWVYKDD